MPARVARAQPAEPADLRSDDRGRAVQGAPGARQRRQLRGQEAGSRGPRSPGKAGPGSDASSGRGSARSGAGLEAPRADQQRAGAQLGRPRGQPPQIGQVTHPPARPRAGGIQLHGPAPGAPAAWQRAAARPAAAAPRRRAMAVVAVRHVARNGTHAPSSLPSSRTSSPPDGSRSPRRMMRTRRAARCASPASSPIAPASPARRRRRHPSPPHASVQAFDRRPRVIRRAAAGKGPPIGPPGRCCRHGAPCPPRRRWRSAARVSNMSRQPTGRGRQGELDVLLAGVEEQRERVVDDVPRHAAPIVDPSPASRSPQRPNASACHSASVISAPPGASQVRSFTVEPRMRAWKKRRRRSTRCLTKDRDQAAGEVEHAGRRSGPSRTS